MECPMHVGHTRACQDKIGFVPINTLQYCVTERYKECPFFKTLNNIGYHCAYLANCPAYKHFQIGDFEIFVEITTKYCLSENNINCERFKLKKTGKEVPEHLLPDGGKIKGQFK